MSAQRDSSPVNAKRLLALLAVAGPAFAQGPDDYLARVQLDTQRCGPYCRVALPPEAYRYSRSADFGDLRILDAAGKAQPYARYRVAPEQARGDAAETRLAVYPVHAPSRTVLAPATRIRADRGADGALRFELDSDAPAAARTTPQAVTAYVLDARALERPVAELKFDATFPAGRLVPVTIERSRDLRSWEMVSAAEPLYRLAGGDRSLERASVRFNAPLNLRDAYLRVTWGTDATFELRAVQAISDPAPQAVRTAVDLPLAASDAKAAEWELPAPRHWEALDLRPAGRNALLPLTAQGRNAPSDPWLDVGRGVVYRIDAGNAGAESVSPPLAVRGGAFRRLRVVVDANAPPLETPPKARLLYPAEEVVFLAQGKPPFTLVAGNAKPSPAGAALALPALLPDYRQGAELKLPTASLAGFEVDAARARPPASLAGYDLRTVGLWVVLVGAVLLLSLFAYRLSRKLRTAPATAEQSASQGRDHEPR